MDGYAVRSADTASAPVVLPVVERIAAGSPAPRSLAAGEAMGIATGGVVPEGADAVVPIEVVLVPAKPTVYTASVYVSTDTGPGGKVGFEREDA